jgi:hypothetical protein
MSVSIAPQLAFQQALNAGGSMQPSPLVLSLLAVVTLLWSTPSAAGWEAYDANGDYLGSVVGVSGITWVAAAYQGDFILLPFEQDGFLGDPGIGTLYETTNCTGTPYMENDYAGARSYFAFPSKHSVFFPKGAISSEVFFDGTTFYAPSGPAVESTSTQSRFSKLEGCSAGSGFETSGLTPLAPLSPQPTFAEPVEFVFLEPYAPVAVSSFGLPAMVTLVGLMLVAAQRRGGNTS